VFDTGRITAFDASVLSPGVDSGKVITLGNPSFLVVHPQGMLLWDTGHPDSLTGYPQGVREAFALMEHRRSLLSQLRAIRVEPGSVDLLALSHLHADHAGNANYFRNATLLIQREEHQAAFGPEPARYLFAPALYNGLSKIKVLDGDFDVFGDGTVVIKKAPGHSPGHQALLVRLPRTGPVLLSGDLYHHAGNRTFRRVPVFNYDPARSRESMERIEQFVRTQGARMWIQHDPTLADTVQYAPYAYR
jgi:glyoxylase-like metal-dependent hydrolase (beta-lactamase superfamily II)